MKHQQKEVKAKVTATAPREKTNNKNGNKIVHKIKKIYGYNHHFFIYNTSNHLIIIIIIIHSRAVKQALVEQEE